MSNNNGLFPWRNAQPGCKGCTERTIGCHSNCEKYNAYKDELAEIRVKKQTNHLIDMTLANNEHHRKHTRVRVS